MNQFRPSVPSAPKVHELARWLSQHISGIEPCGYVQGKTEIRDLLCRELGMSMAQAEDAVEALVASGVLTFEGDPTTAGFEPNARWVVGHPVT
ncbi:MAG: hypothetical protein R3B07_06600 [Polyangiaceae bacterium]